MKKTHDSDAIRAKLEQLNLSQCAAARALGIDPRTMRRYCSGTVTVPRIIWLSLDALKTGKSQAVVKQALRDAKPSKAANRSPAGTHTSGAR